MAGSGATAAPIEAPIITQEDLQAFHNAHFATPSVEYFAEQFLGPVEDEEEDDGLGYYPDGVKRTLTDEQIMMFRHSEIQTLLRERRRAEEESADEDKEPRDITTDLQADEANPHNRSPTSEDGEAFPPQPTKAKRKKSKQNNRGKKSHNQNPKPDLRKRTWDKVETGLHSLDYDEDAYAPSPRSDSAPQRKRISYDDS